MLLGLESSIHLPEKKMVQVSNTCIVQADSNQHIHVAAHRENAMEHSVATHAWQHIYSVQGTMQFCSRTNAFSDIDVGC